MYTYSIRTFKRLNKNVFARIINRFDGIANLTSHTMIGNHLREMGNEIRAQKLAALMDVIARD